MKLCKRVVEFCKPSNLINTNSYLRPMQQKTWKWNLAQNIELRWWKNYLQDKNPTEYLVWKKEYWNNLLAQINDLKFENGCEVLDCGCGPAGVFIILPENIGLDAEDPLLNEYENNLPHFKKAMYPNVKFHALPFEDFTTEKKYDVVFCMNAINHVSDLDLCYDKLSSLLKPNGKLIITIDAHNHPFFKHLFRLIPGDVLHPHQFDLNDYEQLLTKRGLKILQTEKLKQEFFFNHYLQVAQKL